MSKQKYCSTCQRTTKNIIADGWLLLDDSGKYSDWIWECADCTDRRRDLITTIASFHVPSKALPKDFA